jgi:hypothetical protein
MLEPFSRSPAPTPPTPTSPTGRSSRLVRARSGEARASRLSVKARLLAFLQSWRPLHCAILLLAQNRLLLSGAKAGDRDWYNFIGPWADALRLSILKYHQFPWWNPWSMSGQPFFAEPQTAVLMPDTLLLLGFGSVVGYKLVVLFYGFVGYEGSRFLCRQLFGKSRFVDACSIIPALLPPLALHLGVGHVVLLAFWLFPWLLGLGLTWSVSARRSVAFGVVIGCLLLTYLHYTIIIGFTLVGPVVLVKLIRSFRSSEVWRRAALVMCTALGMGLTRIVLTVAFISGFPRTEWRHYPIVASLGQVVMVLIEPLQDRGVRMAGVDLDAWELGSYVGVLALLLAYEGFRRGERKLRPLHIVAALCLLFAWNNRDWFLPAYWMHFVPPWKSMVAITRWRLFACYLVLVGAVQGLVVIRRDGRPRLAAALAALVIFDLGFHVFYAYRGTFVTEAPAFQMAADPPKTVNDDALSTWTHIRMNLVSMGAEFPLLGWDPHPPSRRHIETEGYAGDFVGTKPVEVVSWSPNRIRLVGSPGDTLTLNINPSSYWVMNGQRLFPNDRAMEPTLPFEVTVPSNGRIDLVARPPHLAALLLAQGCFAVLSLLLFRASRKSTKVLDAIVSRATT